MECPSFCHAKLPKAGLGNKLFVWAKALVFAELNALPLLVTGWTRPQKAPLLLGGDLRLYLNYFQRTDQVGWRFRLRAWRGSPIVSDPPVARLPMRLDGTVYEFSSIPSWRDYFGDVRGHRDQLRKSLLGMLAPARQRELERVSSPVMCVHARLGDYRELGPNEDFRKVGNVRTPLTYFADLIEKIRRVHGKTLPVQVFTDGSSRTLDDLLRLPNVSMAPRHSSIVDMLAMSHSRILLASAGSTFSYWSGFLGECAFVHHRDHVHERVRPEDVNRDHYEGALALDPGDWPPLFLENVRNIRWP